MIQKIRYNLFDLENSTDQELVELIYDKATELYFGTFGENLEKADKAMTEFLAIWTLDSEVKNGGFDQFFLNNGTDYGQTVLAGLKRIGANDFGSVTEKAIEVFKNQGDGFENKRNPDFNELDEEFYDLEELEKLQVQYIRKNYKKFVVE